MGNGRSPSAVSLEDGEEAGSTESYVFLRYRDSATVVYKVAVKDGKISSVLQEVYHGESSEEEPDEQRWLVKPEGVLKQPLRPHSPHEGGSR